uniref:Uncharacterized protein n=1 Tax=Anguilla anguilla TaxID=7936 RepID=A0A0E9QJK0_ANGAN
MNSIGLNVQNIIAILSLQSSVITCRETSTKLPSKMTPGPLW